MGFFFGHVGSRETEALVKRATRRACAFLVAGVLGLGLAPAAMADDPLDDLDGTESWDQVAPPPSERKMERRQEDDLKREVADWENIRQQWEMEREAFLLERAKQKRFTASMQPAGPGAVINDENVDQLKRSDDWGDGDGEQWIQPGGNLDKVIDTEIQESTPAAVPHVPLAPPSPQRQATSPSPSAQPAPSRAQVPPPPPVAPTAITPPDMSAGGQVPSAFKQPVSEEGQSGGLAPGPAQPFSEPAPAPVPEKEKASADDEGARAAAEMMRKQEEERKRKAAEAEAQRRAEADAGAAAVAKLLKMQEEKERKEAEALRQKMKLKVDEEGQVVDPELKKEMEED